MKTFLFILALISPICLFSCYNKEINYLDNEVSSLREDLKRMNKNIEQDFEKRIALLEEMLSANSKDAANRGAYLTSIRSELENLKGSIEELEFKVSKRIEPLEQELAKLIVASEKDSKSSEEDTSFKKTIDESVQKLEKEIEAVKKNYSDQLALIKQKIDKLLKNALPEKKKS